jgi:hypothetical protein
MSHSGRTTATPARSDRELALSDELEASRSGPI